MKTVEGQALQIGFTLGLAASQAEVGQLHPAGVAVAAAGIDLQAMEAAALIARQPQPAITSRQAGEVVAQVGGSVCSRSAGTRRGRGGLPRWVAPCSGFRRNGCDQSHSLP